MKLAVISPTKYIQEFTANYRNRINLALAQYILADPLYAAQYKRMSQSGQYVILDNGASELKSSINSSQLFDALKKSGAQEVVCPDVLFDAKQTIERTNKFLDENSRFFHDEGISTMAVCQGKNLSEWLSCYNTYQQDERVDVIGISNTARLFGTANDWDHRIKLITYLKESSMLSKESKPIHLLGLGSNGHWEIKVLSKEDKVRSIDTSAPVVHGYFNIRFSSDSPYTKMPVTLNINWKLATSQIDNVIHNIHIFEEALNDET